MNKFALKIVIKLLTINEDQEDQEFFKVRKVILVFILCSVF